MGMDAPKMEKKPFLKLLPVLLFFAGCGLSDLGFYSADENEEEPGRVISGFEMTETEGERVLWRLSADTAEFLDPDKVKGSGVRVFFYDEEEGLEEERTELRADKGLYRRGSGEIFAGGEVIIVSGSRRIDTSDLTWLPSEEVFITDDPVKITTPAGVVRGMGMRASRDLSDITLMEHISGEFSE